MDETTQDSEVAPSEHGDGRRGGHAAPRLRSTVMLAATALIMVGAAAYVYFSAGTIERWLARLSGPPRVEFNEAYSENASGLASRPFRSQGGEVMSRVAKVLSVT